jgi:hypothetical protein
MLGDPIRHVNLQLNCCAGEGTVAAGIFTKIILDSFSTFVLAHTPSLKISDIY